MIKQVVNIITTALNGFVGDFKERILFKKGSVCAQIIVKKNLPLFLINKALHHEKLQESRCVVTVQNILISSAKLTCPFQLTTQFVSCQNVC
jgi:hypothetical protein